MGPSAIPHPPPFLRAHECRRALRTHAQTLRPSRAVLQSSARRKSACDGPRGRLRPHRPSGQGGTAKVSSESRHFHRGNPGFAPGDFPDAWVGPVVGGRPRHAHARIVHFCSHDRASRPRRARRRATSPAAVPERVPPDSRCSRLVGRAGPPVGSVSACRCYAFPPRPCRRDRIELLRAPRAIGHVVPAMAHAAWRSSSASPCVAASAAGAK